MPRQGLLVSPELRPHDGGCDAGNDVKLRYEARQCLISSFVPLFYLVTWQRAQLRLIQPISNPTQLAKSHSMLACNPSTQLTRSRGVYHVRAAVARQPGK